MADQQYVHLTHTSDWHLGGAGDLASVEALARFTAASASDLVMSRFHLITGDLTEHGKEREYKRAALGVAALEETGDPIIVPGNHDYGGKGLWRQKQAKDRFYRHLIAPRLGGYTLPRRFELGLGWHLFALDSMEGQWGAEDLFDAARGELGSEALQWLDDALGSCAGHKLVALHHHPFDRADPIHGPVHERVLKTNFLELEDAGELARVMAAHDVKACLFGHRHVEQVYRDTLGVPLWFAAGRFGERDRAGHVRYLDVQLHPDGKIGWGYVTFAPADYPAPAQG